MTLLNSCLKLYNFKFTRRLSYVTRNVIKRNAPQLFNSTNITPKNFREISESPQESAISSSIDVSQPLICFKYLRLIKKAIREFGPIVEENKKLELLLAKANQLEIPPDSIEFARRVAVDLRANFGFLELFLMSNCHFIIQYEDLDSSRTKPFVSKLCERTDAFVGQGNIRWPQSFEQKGIISVENDISTPVKEAEAQATALKVGAQCVKQEMDAEGISYLQFICDPGDLHKVKRQIDHEGYAIEEAFVGYIPKNKIDLSTTNRNIVCKLINELSKIPTIDNIFTNVL